MTYRWKLKDIIMVGILGVIFAVIYLAVLYAGLGVTAVLTPYGLGTLGFEIFYGIWFMGATLAMYIIQKPGVAIVTEFLAAFLEMLMGNSGGPMVLLSGAMQGLGCELGFTVFRYKRYDMLSMCMSGIVAASMPTSLHDGLILFKQPSLFHFVDMVGKIGRQLLVVGREDQRQPLFRYHPL
jgi:energy-coupling factor transport system substrate-specific component